MTTLLLFTFCISSALIGCGGVSTNKESKFVLVNAPEKIELTYLPIKGTLKDAQGEPVRGVTVKAVTMTSADESITAYNGNFSVAAKFKLGDAIHFQFQGEGINWTETVQSLPKGVETVTLHFVTDESKRVRLGALEY